MDEASLNLERTAADLLGVEAQFLAQTNSRESVNRALSF
jgi:hypothetical protein